MREWAALWTASDACGKVWQGVGVQRAAVSFPPRPQSGSCVVGSGSLSQPRCLARKVSVSWWLRRALASPSNLVLSFPKQPPEEVKGRPSPWEGISGPEF